MSAIGDPPPLESFADNLYDALFPLAGEDGNVGWHLAYFVGAIGAMFQDVADVARDTPEGPGWSAVVDLTRCPTTWLPWLAQLVGVTVPPGLGDADARAWIASTDGFSRGTPAALKGAVAHTLTGDKTVYFRERDGGDAYALEVVTRTDETPDPAASLAALIAQKPGGIVLTYRTVAGWDYEEMTLEGGTYAAQTAAFATYYDLSNNDPVV